MKLLQNRHPNLRFRITRTVEESPYVLDRYYIHAPKQNDVHYLVEAQMTIEYELLNRQIRALYDCPLCRPQNRLPLEFRKREPDVPKSPVLSAKNYERVPGMESNPDNWLPKRDYVSGSGLSYPALEYHPLKDE